MSKNFFRANEQIRAARVMLIGEDGTSLGVLSLFSALQMAREAGLDLVEISPNNNPPVARIMDFGKYKFEQDKKDKENRHKSKVSELKEIRLSAKIGTHDLEVKAKKARGFVEKGDKVVVSLKLRGRENMFVDRAIVVIRRFAEMVDMDLLESPRKLGNQIRVNLIAKKEVKENAENQNSQS